MPDPLACLTADRWVQVNMQEAVTLESWARSNPQFQSLFNICFNGLISGDIVIETGPQKPAGKTDKIQIPTSEEQAATRWRSRVVTDWSRQKEFTRLCMGFVPVTGMAASSGEGDQFQPTVLNINMIELWFHIDVYNRREWKVYEKSTSVMMNQRRELKGIKMFGFEFPDPSGGIQSCVKRIYQHAYAPYMSKVLLTIEADQRRANPVITTQSSEQNDPQKNVAELGPAFEDPAALERQPDSLRVHALVAEKNGCGSGMPGEQIKKRKRSNEYAIRAGQQYVSAHVPEAPADTLSFSQHFLEVICMEFGVPMSMVSSGDATGKSKLNSESAGPETARIFREAQAERKRRVENDLCEIYRYIWTESDLQKKSKTLKRPLEKSECEEAMQIRVQIPANPQVDQLVDMWERGILKYASMCSVLSNQMGLSLESFNEQAGIDIKDLQGIAPPAEAAAAAKPKKKKAKTKA